ncbi:hypothetical protein PAPYR_8466 [Paratrimastix pyriformis]|uniref:Uncharacterized protein n=1 Tax=Paratrimastix pyriformis TaxID=342808 RepID=A0ABQ8UE27_9EUKA|nr:hypothetical protein PAPYR_8466 [Paratrimastix pyriformis]
MYQLVPQQVPKFCTNRWWYFTKPVYQILVVYQSGPDAPPLQAGTSPKSLGTSPKSSWYFTKITKGTNHTCHMTTLEDQVRYQTALVPSGEAPLNSPWSSSVSEAARQYRRKGPKKYHSLYQNQLGTFLASTKKSTRKVPGRVPEKYQGEYQKSTKGGYQEYQTTRYKNFLVLFGTFPLSSCITSPHHHIIQRHMRKVVRSNLVGPNIQDVRGEAAHGLDGPQPDGVVVVIEHVNKHLAGRPGEQGVRQAQSLQGVCRE